MNEPFYFFNQSPYIINDNITKEVSKIEYKTRLLVTDYLKAGKVTQIGEHFSIEFIIQKNSFPYDLRFDVYTGAFGNCQNVTVRNSNKIIFATNDYQEFKDVLLYIVEHSKKKVIIFDIKESYYDQLIKLIEGHNTEEKLFLVKQKYTNLTNNIMYCLYINTNNL
jgi:Zn-dependent M32 family carboxypeptidase